MSQILWIGLGGFLGAVLRFLVSVPLNAISAFPIGTLSVNVAGAFLIGALGAVAERFGVLSPEARAFLFIGLLGALTTFSTFSVETFNLVNNGQAWLGFLNAVANLALCFGAVWIGRCCGSSVRGAARINSPLVRIILIQEEADIRVGC